MNAERWRRISGVFDAVLQREPAGRQELLDELSDGDEEVRREVERLLSAEESGLRLLDDPVVRLGKVLPESWSECAATPRAGPYRLLRRIGRGAMSEVFLAVRDDDAYRRQVAVKLIRSGVEESCVLRRFLAERQILASLDHPNIARLFGGGTADDGRPYLVMEHVDGVPITEYCDRRRLGIRSRLRLFLEVCAAVQHAHQSLLVHRDLKPGNILVTPAGVTKLLDFGIAKPLAPREGLEQCTTQTGYRPMTPSYASPEQVRGGAITTASDVYSMGVLLFELLTGSRPYRLEGELPHELEQAICEQEVAAPSLSFGQLRDGERAAAERAARQRGCSPAELRRLLMGDLDTIVARALSKEPARRYGSARQLGRDIERHLKNLPIAARQDHIGYRLTKFARRYRGALIAASVGVVLVGGLLSVLRWQAGLLESTRSRAEQVSDLLLERLATRGPSEEPGATAVPREALDISLWQIGGRLMDEPAALAGMLETMGGVYQQVGLAEDARWLLEEALVLRRDYPGAGDLTLAGSLHSLGESLLLTGESERGAALLRQALALRRSATDGASWALAESLEALARFAWGMGALDEAEPLLLESMEVRLQICPDSAWTARGLSDLAEFRLERQQFAEVERLQARAAAIRDQLSPTHFDAPRTIEDRALLHFARGEPEAAEHLFRQAVEMRRGRVGESHEAVARTLVWQARALISQQRYEEAVEALRQALAVHRRLQLGEGPARSNLLKYLGAALAGEGELDAGEAMLRKVIELESARLSPHHPQVALSRGLLAGVLEARRDWAGAEELYRRAASELAGHPEWEFGAGSEPRLELAALLLERGDAIGARTEGRRVLEVIRARHPRGHWRLERAESLVGDAVALSSSRVIARR